MKNTVLFLLLPLWLASCERRELTYYTEAEITVTVDWSRADQQEESQYGATLIFYPQDGGTPRVVLMGDRTQTTVRLPYGRYDAILFNRSFDEFGTMAFRGQEQLHTLEAYALQTETRYGTKIITAAPGKLASAVIRDFEVTDNMLGNYAPAGVRNMADCPDGACRLQFTPLPLTRKVKVKLHITGIDNLKQATCQLSGVPLSVYLHDGNTDNAEKGAQEFEIEDITPDEDFAANGTLNGLIHLFGLPAPEEVQIKVRALLKDNTTVVEREVENIEANEEADGSGVTTLHIKADITEPLPDIKPSEDSGFGADVEEWGQENNTEIPI